MRYYSTKRPVTPGSYPKQKFAVKIHNFEQKTFCKEIGCEAWGYIEYSIDLPEADIEDYELLSENLKTFWAVTTAVKPENSSKSLKRSDVYTEWFESEQDAAEFVQDARCCC